MSSASNLPKKSIGKLVFKGDKDKKKLSRQPTTNSSSNSSSSISINNDNDGDDDGELTILPGTGRIAYTSSITVHGTDTKFLKELEPGDAIIVSHPTTLRDETKIVKMVLSDLSIGISSAFSTDLISSTSFSYIKAVTAKESQKQAEDNAANAKAKGTKLEEQALGTYGKGGSEKFVYRVKNASSFGGYKIVEETVSNKTRGDLLDMRSKKKSDRFCG